MPLWAALCIWCLFIIVVVVIIVVTIVFLEKAVKKKEAKEKKAKGIQWGPVNHNSQWAPKLTVLLIFCCEISADERVLKELQEPAKKGARVWQESKSWNKSL